MQHRGDPPDQDVAHGAAADVLAALATVPVREPSPVAPAGDLAPAAAASPGPAPTGVLLADPLAIRARRFRAVFVCGLQEGVFPARPAAEPFLSDEDRRGLARAAGLRLALHEDVLDRERALFYAAVSRPTDLLALSWRAADDEGQPAVRSLFVDDVVEVSDTFRPGAENSSFDRLVDIYNKAKAAAGG